MKTTAAALATCALSLAAWRTQAQQAPADPVPPDAACLSHMLKLSQAMAMYTRDNDSRFPPADAWNEALAPLLAKPAAGAAAASPSPFDCPLLGAGEWGYSMNWKLSKRRLDELDSSANTVAIYETNVPRPNANYDGRDRISRHVRQSGGVDGVPISNESGGNLAFADGSVGWASATYAPNFRIFLDNKPRQPK